MKLKSFSYENFSPVRLKKGVYMLATDCQVLLNTDRGLLQLYLRKGFKWNGASTPWVFQWVIPSWDDGNERANVASCFHDAAFANKGWGLLSYEDSNDVYRGMLREAGYKRFNASAGCFALNNFGKSHWGNDDFCCKEWADLTDLSRTEAQR